ncbi:MAG: hypothetical protein COT85_02445 [Chlamydiae bacterium CG10_big_fil_rev_8_21_14_0_10_42_34]|nr:MAG: hypothetical protein COT85_02445 [Chlamydiae bacterium CG10_big_fil_rev_8_21_14_0_10_42_34]
MAVRLQFSSNHLCDIKSWLENGHCVSLESNTIKRHFHQAIPDGKTDLQERLIVHLNVGRQVGILNDGEWDRVIKDAGFVECIACPKNTIHSRRLKL